MSPERTPLRKALRPVAWTVAAYALLIWGYCCLRMITSPSCEGMPFIDGIPVNMWETALGAFLVSAGGFWYALAS